MQLDLLSYTPLQYPKDPGYRKVDTSIEAAIAIKPVSHKYEQEILDALADYGPMTFWEISKVTNIPFDNAQPCVSRMGAAGKVVDSGERRKNPNGRNSKVWRLA